MPRRLLITSVLVAAVITMTGCAAGTPVPTPTPVATPLGDKTLNIVNLLETAGNLAAFAPAQEAGTELAVREVNDAGGVGGNPVMIWHRTDALPATLEQAASAVKADAAIVAANPAAATSLLEPATKAKIALLAIGTDKNIAEPTVKPYPDASNPASSSDKPTGKATSSPATGTSTPGASTPQPGTSAPSSSADRKAGAPAVPTPEFVALLKTSNPFLTEFTYGAESYQLVIALALAATVANDDAGPSLIRGLEQVTTGDVVCTDYASCLSVLEDNRAIKYIGPAGRMAYDARVGVVTFRP
jgi:branched-chain amino acid transport system substrate-binding protein